MNDDGFVATTLPKYSVLTGHLSDPQPPPPAGLSTHSEGYYFLHAD